jgi:Ni/Co efflux regulator RcnB
MRTLILATIAIAGSAIAFPATAQQQPGRQKAAPSVQTNEQMHQDVDKQAKTGEQTSEQMQRKADKGIKTRNSGESGYVAEQDRPGASAHAPGRPEPDQTTGSTSGTGNVKAHDRSR